MKKIYIIVLASFVLGMLSLSSLAAENIPRFGSSGKLEGNIAVVTMFLDDARTSWNFKKKQDLEMYDYAYSVYRLPVTGLQNLVKNMVEKLILSGSGINIMNCTSVVQKSV